MFFTFHKKKKRHSQGPLRVFQQLPLARQQFTHYADRHRLTRSLVELKHRLYDWDDASPTAFARLQAVPTKGPSLGLPRRPVVLYPGRRCQQRGGRGGPFPAGGGWAACRCLLQPHPESGRAQLLPDPPGQDAPGQTLTVAPPLTPVDVWKGVGSTPQTSPDGSPSPVCPVVAPPGASQWPVRRR